MVTLGRWQIDFVLWTTRIFLGVAVLWCGLKGFPWWTLAVPSFLAGLTFTSARKSFLQVALVAAVVWMAYALYQDSLTGLRLSSRISGVMGAPFGPVAYVLTGAIAGLIAGLAGWCGQTTRKLVLR